MVSSSQHILITGGAGFIGSHLCEHFLKKGFRVTCVDNLITGHEENIRPFLENKDFVFLKQDISVPFAIQREVHFIMNMASPASPVDYQKFSLETLRVGSAGTWNLLELAKTKKARFLMASTSEVYGDPQVHPQREDYWGNVNSIGLRSCYDEAKRFSESLTMTYHRVHGVETRLARIFNTYGPGMDLKDGRALPNFLTQALQNQDLTVFGDGSQTRSFCYVSDMVEGLSRLLFSDETGPVNLGNPHEISLLDFAKLVLRLSDSKSKITYHPLPSDDPKIRRPDITKAKRVLEWEPRWVLEEGLKKTIPYFVETLKQQKTKTV